MEVRKLSDVMGPQVKKLLIRYQKGVLINVKTQKQGLAKKQLSKHISNNVFFFVFFNLSPAMA